MTAGARLHKSGVLLPGLFALVGLAILVSLGLWQVERLGWKQELIAVTETRSQADPVALPPVESWSGLEESAYEYRPVRFAGVFDHARELYVYTALSNPRGEHGGPGWWVMTPLTLPEGGTVFVNRGFVPDSRRAPDTRSEGLTEGTVEIVGLMRAPEPRGPFVPDDDIAENTWFTRDPAPMADALGLAGPVAPFFVDAATPAPGGLPQGGETTLSFRNDHLGYAITWFGLAATLVAVFGFWAYGRLAANSADN